MRLLLWFSQEPVLAWVQEWVLVLLWVPVLVFEILVVELLWMAELEQK
jgi:hypothetical protein